MRFSHKPQRATTGGFSLAELIVVMSIFVIITTILVVRNQQFNETTLLQNLAYDVALSIREMQSYGINVRGADSGGTTVFSAGYGIEVLRNDETHYTLFADLNGNHKRDTNEPILKTAALSGGYTIHACATRTTGPVYCTHQSPFISGVDVTFIRPNPDAFVKASTGFWNFVDAQIIVESPGGNERVIAIEPTGHIAVTTPSP